MHSSLNIAVTGALPDKRAEVAHTFGKKGSSDDMTFYHTVFQGKILSVVEPTGYPDKLTPLLNSLSLCDWNLVIGNELTPALGECIVAADLLGVKTAFLSQADLKPILSNTSLSSAPFFDTLDEAKEFLLTQASPAVAGPVRVTIDHFFEVKGVGSVALGLVKSGELHIHDKLTAYPAGSQVEVKSIQMNDENVEASGAGGRVGLALKNVVAGDVERGTILAKEGVSVAKELSCTLAVAKFCRDPVKNGAVFHLSAGMQFDPCRLECAADITAGKSGPVKLVFEKPIAYWPEQKMLLCNLNGKGLRVVGVATV
jgi:selenocysteine-specific translation elongation factor